MTKHPNQISLVLRAVPAVAATMGMAAVSMRSFELSALFSLYLLFILHALYYWGIHRPSLFPAWLAFLLGFLIDIVAGKLLGLNAFLMVFLQVVIARQRRYLLSQPFATQWAGFMLLVVVAEMMRWGIMAVVSMTLFSPLSAIVAAVFCGVLYPLTASAMQGCLRIIVPEKTSETLE